MKLVIIPIDGAVYVDGFSYSDLDLSFCPSDVHAVQWNVSKGWIEFKENDEGIKHANQVILELPAWALKAKGKWDEEAARLAAEEAARLAAEEAARLAAEEAARLAAEEAAKQE